MPRDASSATDAERSRNADAHIGEPRLVEPIGAETQVGNAARSIVFGRDDDEEHAARDFDREVAVVRTVEPSSLRRR